MHQPFAGSLKGSHYEGGGKGHMPAFIPWRRIGTTCPSRRGLFPCYIRLMAYLAAMRHPFAPAYKQIPLQTTPDEQASLLRWDHTGDQSW